MPLQVDMYHIHQTYLYIILKLCSHRIIYVRMCVCLCVLTVCMYVQLCMPVCVYIYTLQHMDLYTVQYICVCGCTICLLCIHSMSIYLLTPVHLPPVSHLPPIFLLSSSYIFLPSVHCLILTSYLPNAMPFHHPDSMFLSSVSCHLVGALLVQFLSGALGISGESNLRQFKRHYQPHRAHFVVFGECGGYVKVFVQYM